MKINPELVEKIEKDLSIFGLAVCALNIVRYIAGRTVKSEFYISLSDFLKEIPNCSSSETEQVINYLATTTPQHSQELIALSMRKVFFMN